MFKSLIRKFSGIKGYNELLTKSVGIVKTFAADDNSVIGCLARNKESLLEWINFIRPDLIAISNASSKREQILKLREATVASTEILFLNKPFFENDRSEEEKAIIANEFYHDIDFKEAKIQAVRSYIYASASCACYRSISKDLGDASDNDWFAMYCHLYDMFVVQLHNDMIAREKDEVSLISIMLSGLRQSLDERKEEILQGYQWDYDRDKIEREMKEEEQQRNAEEKARKPPIAKTVSNHQTEELSEFLRERYYKAVKGELYKLEGHSPKNLANVLFVDTGIMLIALSECVDNFETAKHSNKKIIHLVFDKLNTSDNVHKLASEIPLDIQLAIYNIKTENEGWLANVCIAATYLIHDIDAGTLTEKENEELGRASFNSCKDAWYCYATTMNIFGYDMDPKLLAA